MHISPLSAAVTLLSLASTAFADGRCSRGPSPFGDCHFNGLFPQPGQADVHIPCDQYWPCVEQAAVCHVKENDHSVAKCINQKEEPQPPPGHGHRVAKGRLQSE